MNLLGMFKRKPATTKAASVTATVMVQGRPDWWQSYSGTSSYLPQQSDVEVMRILRQALPVLDTAVDMLVRLTGKANVAWESERAQAEWDSWQSRVPVAPLGIGLNKFMNGHIERTLMMGTGAGETALDGTGTEIHALMHIPSRTLRLRQDPEDPTSIIVAQQQSGSAIPVELNREFVVVNAHDPEDYTPYGRSMFSHCPFIAELSIEMIHALKQDWNRVGAPSFAVTVDVPAGLDPNADVEGLMTAMVNSIKSEWSSAMTNRKQGKNVTDFIGAGKINIQTIGADGQRLEFEVPWRAAMEQIVAVTHLPPWLLGFHWSTTERLSEEQAQALEDVVIDIQDDFTPTILFIADLWARLHGYANVPRDVAWPSMAIRDRVELARAELINAQAEAKREETASKLWRNGIYDQQQYAVAVTGDEMQEVAQQMDAPAASGSGTGSLLLSAKLPDTCSCGHVHKADDAPTSIGTREEPADQRIADAIDGFLADARAAVDAMEADVWRILRLPEVERDALEEPFAFTPEQEAALDRAIGRFLATMAGTQRDRAGFIAPETGDGVIQQYNRFSWSIGATRVREMTDAEAVLVSTDRNSEAVRSLLGNAFDRLSDNGRMRLEGVLDDIKDRLREGVELGENPLSIARDLRNQFDGYRGWQFERLARTEVAFAQNAGEIEEMRAEGVDVSGVENDPPPWHPHCLCDLSIQENDDGTWRAVYLVAATACDLCQSYVS